MHYYKCGFDMKTIPIEKQLQYLLNMITDMGDCQKEFHFDIDTSRLIGLNHIEYDAEIKRQIEDNTRKAIAEGDLS